MKEKKILAMAVMLLMMIALAFSMIMPAVQGVIIVSPEPDVLWKNTNSTDDVTDVAIGDLNGDNIDDVAFIDIAIPDTVFAVYGNNGTVYWKNENVEGYSIAVGNIDDDNLNEVICGGWNASESDTGITVFENDGAFKFFYATDSNVTDIEIGDVGNDGTDDIIACDPVGDGYVYAIKGSGENVTGWPIGPLTGAIVDIAVGNLDGIGGLDVAAIGDSALYVNNSGGFELWHNDSVGGRSVEIGDVDNDSENEVVVGDYGCNYVYVYDGDTGDLEYSFDTDHDPIEVELGDLDEDGDMEIAVITTSSVYHVYAINIEGGSAVEMWNYSLYWHTIYYGEGIAIADVDRDYKNEVMVAYGSGDPPCVYAFDGLDSDGNGEGDIVWKYYMSDYNEEVNDIEVGDIDGDGDTDVVVGTSHGIIERCVYALGTEEHTVDFDGDTIFFDSDPSNITEVNGVGFPAPPPEGYNFPYGLFELNITVINPGNDSFITITAPDNFPVGTVYWKYGPTLDNTTSHWYQVSVLDDDGDNVIVIVLTDGGDGDDDLLANIIIIDQGGPAYPYPTGVSAITPIGIILSIGLLAMIAVIILKKKYP